jgi:hypothetical protein
MTAHAGTIPVSLPDDIPHGIAALVPKALALIERHFPGAQRIEGAMGWDPELDDIGSEWLELRLTVDASVQEILEADNAYTRDWVAAVPFPGYLLVQVHFNFL